MKKVAVSGYFNPLHIGHIRLLKEAKNLGNYLIVILNNDFQVKLKGSVPFMSIEDRKEIVASIRYVDEVFISIDKDKSICKSLISIKPNRNEIIKGIHTLYSKKFQTKIKTTKSPYGEGGANKKIIKILKKIKLKNILKKKFYSLNVRCA